MTSIYNTGTVTVTNGSAVVTGSGTAWAVSLVTGGMFTQVGVAVPILSVDSDTQITLVYAWPGTTDAGAAYAIDRENSLASNVVDLYDKLTRVLVQLSLAGITPNSSGNLTDRAALTLAMADKGYLFLHAEIGVAFAFYRWNGTSWDGPFPVANASGGAVSSLAAGDGVAIDATNPAIPVVSATPHAATSKATPVDADEMSLFDSAATFGLKKLTWANLKAGVLAYFNGTAKAIPIAADRVYIGDSAASNAVKYSTWTQILAAIFGTAALANTGTSGATVPLLNAANTFSGIQTFSAIPSLTGGGIQFPATQVPSADANTLDDYEEGTFTPSITFSTPGNLSVVYTGQSGTYTKVGRLVSYSFLITTSTFSFTTSSGLLQVTGLPFGTAGAFVGSGALVMQGYTKANFTTLVFETGPTPGNTFFYVQAGGSGQIRAELAVADVPTGTAKHIFASGTYNAS